MDITKLDELARMQHRYADLYDGGGLCELRSWGVHMEDDAFFSVFSLEECARRENMDRGPTYQYTAVYGGAAFYCLSERRGADKAEGEL